MYRSVPLMRRATGMRLALCCFLLLGCAFYYWASQEATDLLPLFAEGLPPPHPAAAYAPSTDTSLRACTPEEGGRLPQTYAASPMLPTSALRHAPDFPNWPPSHPGPCVLRDDKLLPEAPLAFAVLVTAWNRAGQIRVTIAQLLKLTREPWELIFLDMTSTDDTLSIVSGVLDRYIAGWPLCDGTEGDEALIDVLAQWPSGTSANATGNVGVECQLRGAPPPSLMRVRLLYTPDTGLLNTGSNNLQMRLAREPTFHVIVDDDQFMTVPGWNSWLAAPLREYADVFSVSMRCAHGWPDVGQLIGSKCVDSGAPQSGFPWGLHVADSGNRGPLLLRAEYARALGFLDEINFVGRGGDDHELNVRARATSGWVSGFLPVPWTEERCCRSRQWRDGAAASDRYMRWWEARRARGPPVTPLPPAGRHNHMRALNVTPRWASEVFNSRAP